jgi:hypothetical protein
MSKVDPKCFINLIKTGGAAFAAVLNGCYNMSPSGDESWWVNGVRHRDDGPAFISANKHLSWRRHGEDIDREVNEWMKENNISYPFTDEQKVLFKLTFF